MEVFSQVASNFARNKLRSFLTMAGIAWGVASIVLIVAMGDGFKEGQHKNTRALGQNIVMVFGGRTEKQAGGERAGRRVRLTEADVRDVRAECYLVSKAVVELENQVSATSRYNSGSFTTLGVEPMYPELRTIPVDDGRFISDGDQSESRRVCVLGENVRKQLFGARTGAVGMEIRLNGIPFTIIGLSPDKKQNSGYNGLDVDKIFIPYSTMVRDLPPKDPTYLAGNPLDHDLYAGLPRGLESGAGPGAPRAWPQSRFRSDRRRARSACGTPSRAPNWWTRSSNR